MRPSVGSTSKGWLISRGKEISGHFPQAHVDTQHGSSWEWVADGRGLSPLGVPVGSLRHACIVVFLLIRDPLLEVGPPSEGQRRSLWEQMCWKCGPLGE